MCCDAIPVVRFVDVGVEVILVMRIGGMGVEYCGVGLCARVEN